MRVEYAVKKPLKGTDISKFFTTPFFNVAIYLESIQCHIYVIVDYDTQ